MDYQNNGLITFFALFDQTLTVRRELRAIRDRVTALLDTLDVSADIGPKATVDSDTSEYSYSSLKIVNHQLLVLWVPLFLYLTFLNTLLLSVFSIFVVFHYKY